MSYKKIVLFSLLAGFLALSGCTLPTTTASKSGSDGGIWFSIDSGRTLSQAVKVPSVDGKIITISNVDVTMIAIDPSDSQAVYLGTKSNGIIYSYDGGSSWRQFRDLNKVAVSSLAVDPKNKCVLYAAVSNKLYKSADCGRSWQNPYFHQKPAVSLTDVAISRGDSDIILMGNSDGELLKSVNGGQSWKTVLRAKSGPISDIVLDPNDSAIVYAGTQKSGLYKSVDNGENWAELGEGLKSYAGTHEYKKLIADPATDNGLIFISKYGLLRSTDGGGHWDLINLLPAPKATTISAVAVNPKNSREIYYTTQNTLVKSTDGGQTWSSVKLPYTRLTSFIAINPSDPRIIYLGTQLPPKN